ncbi:MAG TPA: cysteine desulfurase family protein [Flavobacterium sp.]|jgi:cysteine desulfurase|nr:cysteine desulfurase [Flavobacterium sp.]HQV35406.1 cysteine desulfurase family protein [Flavobacterium sp.]HQX03444.1 cysteine desulfurase family protein [Flavobacterium sp.]HRZ30925.1 cysteine desulfurase family protein [Flavobacterium sp.]HRZ73528.1 cysteine desulfurase family protein [Flavobacterium sp.]
MNKIYLDNASTTAIHPEVIQEMTRVMQSEYGNPSSSHSFGRGAKAVLESARKSIAKQLNCTAQEIIFTSSGTEANNWILQNAVKKIGIKRIITSKMEHHAVVYPILALQKEFGIEVEFLKVLPNGQVDYLQLTALLDSHTPTLVSLMHVNNETGVVLDIERVGELCKLHKAYFHSDTVQSMGKTELDLQQLNIDFLVASGHKFHGPKGVGFAFIKKNTPIAALLVGGEQEKGLRAGTEAVHQIAGIAKALEFAYEGLESQRDTIFELKKYTIEKLTAQFPSVKFNGGLETFYTILNVQLPLAEDKTSIILFELDMKGIAVSRGSACQSGSIKPSHVLVEFLSESELKKPSLRLSFNQHNTKEEIDYFVSCLAAM